LNFIFTGSSAFTIRLNWY